MAKNLERKKKGQTQGRTNRRMPICNPTIQLVVVDLYTKYEVSILNGCGDIFDEKVFRNYGRTDGRTDGTTDRCKPVYPPLFQSGGITSQSLKVMNAPAICSCNVDHDPTILKCKPEFYGDLVDKFRKIIGKIDFPYQNRTETEEQNIPLLYLRSNT